MSRNKHPNKEIERALKYAEKKGWRVKNATGHAHSSMYCPYNDSNCRGGMFCITSVWSTPKNPENHARLIKRVVDGCSRLKDSGNEKMEDKQ